jgi:hypothetical protein
MSKPSKDKDIQDEPGAEDRFMHGIGKALSTPPKPFTPKKTGKKTASVKKKKSTGK